MKSIEDNLKALEKLNKKIPWGKTYRCAQCGKPMNVVDYIVSPVCSECCKRNHQKVIKGGKH